MGYREEVGTADSSTIYAGNARQAAKKDQKSPDPTLWIRSSLPPSSPADLIGLATTTALVFKTGSTAGNPPTDLHISAICKTPGPRFQRRHLGNNGKKDINYITFNACEFLHCRGGNSGKDSSPALVNNFIVPVTFCRSDEIQGQRMGDWRRCRIRFR